MNMKYEYMDIWYMNTKRKGREKEGGAFTFLMELLHAHLHTRECIKDLFIEWVHKKSSNGAIGGDFSARHTPGDSSGEGDWGCISRCSLFFLCLFCVCVCLRLRLRLFAFAFVCVCFA
jgi:hypothetical protein